MDKIRWAEIAANPSRVRFDCLSKFMSEAGLPNEVDYVESGPSSLCDDIKKLTVDHQQIRVGPPYGELAVGCFPQSTAQVMLLKSCDAITKQNDNWWTRSYLQMGFLRQVASKVKKLDINASVLLVGAGGAARSIFAALLKIGFTKFVISDRFEERASILTKSLKRQYFNVDIKFVPPSAITTLPGTHSLLINATPLLKTNEVLDDLMYFNFFTPGGAVVDLTLTPISTPLILEAERIGAQIIRGYEIAAQTDVLWAKDACGIAIDLEKYTEALKAELEKIPVDPAWAPAPPTVTEAPPKEAPAAAETPTPPAAPETSEETKP